MKRSVKALEKISDGYNCAQAVFYAFCDNFDMSREMALKVACGFGAGMGRKQEVCGAVSGGIMVIGALYGRGENDDSLLTQEVYAKVRILMDKIAEKQGSFICRELLEGCDFKTLEGQDEFKEKDLFNRVCREVIKEVVETVEEIIENK